MKLFVIFILAALFVSACQSNPYQEGQRIYERNCANCHMENGQGLGALIPPLAGVDYLAEHRERLPCIIRYGLADTIVIKGQVYAEKMIGYGHLSDIQITNVLNYINQSWGNQNAVYRLDEVRNLLEKCQ
jgi:mono/diheme cytochrome c family protein